MPSVLDDRDEEDGREISLPQRVALMLGFSRPLSPAKRGLKLKEFLRYCEPVQQLPAGCGKTLDLYRVMVEYIRHENELLHQRTSWFLAIQGVLGAAAGWIYGQSTGALLLWLRHVDAWPPLGVRKQLLMWLILCMVGIVTSAVARNTIDAALYAQDSVAKLWRRVAPLSEASCLPDMMGGKGNYDAVVGGSFAGAMPGVTLALWRTAILAPALLSLAGHYTRLLD